MKITEVRVEYGTTQSLPEYSNVKPSLALTAVLSDGDDPETVKAALLDQCRAFVHEQVDQALEAVGRAARYDACPRFQVLIAMTRGTYERDRPVPPPTIVILPDEHQGRIEGYVHAFWEGSRKLRYANALKRATEKAEKDGLNLVDCSDGDLSRIPGPVVPEPEPVVFHNHDTGESVEVASINSNDLGTITTGVIDERTRTYHHDDDGDRRYDGTEE